MIEVIFLGLYLLVLIFLLFFIREKKTDIPRPNQLSEDKKVETERAWEYLKAFDDRYNARVNYLLVAESMLLLSFVTAFLASNKNLEGIRSAIAFIGMIFTGSWLFINLRLIIQINTISFDYLLREDPVFHDLTKKKVKKSPTAGLVLTYILPNSMILLWFFLFSFNNGFADHFIEKSILLYIPILILLNLTFRIVIIEN